MSVFASKYTDTSPASPGGAPLRRTTVVAGQMGRTGPSERAQQSRPQQSRRRGGQARGLWGGGGGALGCEGRQRPEGVLPLILALLLLPARRASRRRRRPASLRALRCAVLAARRARRPHQLHILRAARTNAPSVSPDTVPQSRPLNMHVEARSVTESACGDAPARPG